MIWFSLFNCPTNNCARWDLNPWSLLLEPTTVPHGHNRYPHQCWLLIYIQEVWWILDRETKICCYSRTSGLRHVIKSGLSKQLGAAVIKIATSWLKGCRLNVCSCFLFLKCFSTIHHFGSNAIVKDFETLHIVLPGMATGFITGFLNFPLYLHSFC